MGGLMYFRYFFREREDKHSFIFECLDLLYCLFGKIKEKVKVKVLAIIDSIHHCTQL